jgi:hypothetical protein
MAAKADDLSVSCPAGRLLRSESCRMNSETSNVYSGSGRELHLAWFIAEELPLEFRFPVAALGH